MNTLIHANIFFFVATLGVVVLVVLLAIFLFYSIGIIRKVKRISDTLEKTTASMSEDAHKYIRDVRETVLYKTLFRHKKRKHD